MDDLVRVYGAPLLDPAEPHIDDMELDILRHENRRLCERLNRERKHGSEIRAMACGYALTGELPPLPSWRLWRWLFGYEDFSSASRVPAYPPTPATCAGADAPARQADTLWLRVQQGTLAIPRGGYPVRRSRGRIIVEAAKQWSAGLSVEFRRFLAAARSSRTWILRMLGDRFRVPALARFFASACGWSAGLSGVRA